MRRQSVTCIYDPFADFYIDDKSFQGPEGCVDCQMKLQPFQQQKLNNGDKRMKTILCHSMITIHHMLHVGMYRSSGQRNKDGRGGGS